MRLERWGLLVGLVLACAGCSGDGSGLRPTTAADNRAKGAEVHTELGQRYMQDGNLKALWRNSRKPSSSIRNTSRPIP